MYYSIDTISYCFPFDVTKYVLNRVFNTVLCKPELYGVLSPYIEKKMTEQEADDFLCEVIQRHPYIENSMELKIEVMWHDGNTSGFYQTLTIRNPIHGGRQKYEPSPVRWR